MQEDTEQTPVTLAPTQLTGNLGSSHNNFSKYYSMALLSAAPARRGELVFCNVPPGMLAHPDTAWSHSQVPHTRQGQRNSSVLTLAVSCAKPARCVQLLTEQCPHLGASAPAVLSPPWLSPPCCPQSPLCWLYLGYCSQTSNSLWTHKKQKEEDRQF